MLKNQSNFTTPNKTMLTDQEKLKAITDLSYKHATQFEDHLGNLLDDSNISNDDYDTVKGIVRQCIAFSKSQEIERDAIHKLVGAN